MSLPPERIVLKRRRGEEAVECLYLQENRDKRIRSDFHWAKLTSDGLNHTEDASSRPSNASGHKGICETGANSRVAQIPKIRSTLPETKDETPRKLVESPLSDHKDSPRGKTEPLKNDAPSEMQRPVPPPKARHFHLVKNSLSSPNLVATGHGIQKNRSKGKRAVALFAERRAVDALRLLDQHQSSDSKATSNDASEGATIQENHPLQSETGTYKKPNAPAEEVRWRAKTWNKKAQNHVDGDSGLQDSQHSNNHHMSDEDYSLQLAIQLQEFAFQETQSGPSPFQSKERKAQQKFQPKPPKSRLGKSLSPISHTAEGRIAKVAIAGDDEEDFVYDTFIRSEGIIPFDFAESDAILEDSSQAPKSRGVGLLVIEEEDKVAWQEYAEDDDSEREWDTDDEDENAEDYYGNDYPEDELESDDEFDRDVYKYRKYASDNEEYDEDLDNLSGNDDEARL